MLGMLFAVAHGTSVICQTRKPNRKLYRWCKPRSSSGAAVSSLTAAVSSLAGLGFERQASNHSGDAIDGEATMPGRHTTEKRQKSWRATRSCGWRHRVRWGHSSASSRNLALRSESAERSV